MVVGRRGFVLVELVIVVFDLAALVMLAAGVKSCGDDFFESIEALEARQHATAEKLCEGHDGVERWRGSFGGEVHALCGDGSTRSL